MAGPADDSVYAVDLGSDRVIQYRHGGYDRAHAFQGSPTGEPLVQVTFADGRSIRQEGLRLDRKASAMLFGRTGEVRMVRAMFN